MLEAQIQQHEDDQQRERHHQLELGGGAFEELELPRPRHRVARRQCDLFGHRALHVAHRRAQIAAAQVDIHIAGQPRVLAAQHRRTVCDADVGHVGKHELLPARGDDRQRAQSGERIADLARVTDIDREALQALDRFADVHAADRRTDHRLHVGDVEAIAGRRLAPDVHVYIAPAGQALGEGAGHSRHVLQGALDLAGQPVDGGELRPEHLDPHRALDAGGEHVEAIADRWHPDVGQTRYAHDLVEFIDQLDRRHAGPPLLARLELDGCLEHHQRRGVGGGRRAPRLAIDAIHFRHALDQAIGLLQELGRLAGGQAR